MNDQFWVIISFLAGSSAGMTFGLILGGMFRSSKTREEAEEKALCDAILERGDAERGVLSGS